MADQSETIVFGAGVAGLTAAYALARAGRRVQVLEGAVQVGGLARTIVNGGFRFDLGGHRFFTHDAGVEKLVRALLGPELLTVPRSSRIRLRGRWIEYPLRPRSTLAGLGLATSAGILLGYARARLAQRLRPTPLESLENWVVAHFGRPLFDLYFRDYSEKVWGIGCRDVSAAWMAQRVQGLSLGAAVRQALSRRRSVLPTLTDHFYYPRLGIGRIAERLREEVERNGTVRTNTRVTRVHHNGRRIEGVTVRHGDGEHDIGGAAFLSTLPLTQLVQALQPHAPAEIRALAARMRYRDLVVVTVMVDRERVTDQTWIYLPETEIPFGRLHEPANWSADMAPAGHSSLVTERFCFRGDPTWSASDAALIDDTTRHLARLGFLRPGEVCGGSVVRVAAAYPLFEVGFEARSQTLYDYLARFDNLQVAGRGGLFRYHNLDHAMASGLAAAAALQRVAARPDEPRAVLAGGAA